MASAIETTLSHTKVEVVEEVAIEEILLEDVGSKSLTSKASGGEKERGTHGFRYDVQE